MIARLCGYRKEAGVYSCCGLSRYGLPVEHFIYDPPKPVDIRALGATAVGVKLIEVDRIWHILDWIGESNYPHVADFIEEVRRLGMSRRLPITLDYSKLTQDSKHILIHPHGYIEDWEEYYRYRAAYTERWIAERGAAPDFRCPKQVVCEHPNVSPVIASEAYLIASRHNGIPSENDIDEETDAVHELPHEMCSSLWWEDHGSSFEGVSRLKRVETTIDHYMAHSRPHPIAQPVYQPALIARFPISNIAVINGNDHERVNKSLEAAKRSTITVTLEEE